MTCSYCSTYPMFAGNTDFVSGTSHFKKETVVKHSKNRRHKHCSDICLNKESGNKPVVQGFQKQECIIS